MKTYAEFMSEASVKSLLKKPKISLPDTKKLVTVGSKLRIPDPHHVVRNILRIKRPNIKAVGSRSATRTGKRIGNAIAKKIGL
jgi:hypothetical protein